ncbi:MAG: cation diffusion facilitator family transporter, partial [Chryseobacterium sp.]
VAGIFIIIKSTYDLIYPSDIKQLYDGATIIGFTGLVNSGVGYYLIKVGKQHRSITLEADGKHLLTDSEN